MVDDLREFNNRHNAESERNHDLIGMDSIYTLNSGVSSVCIEIYIILLCSNHVIEWYIVKLSLGRLDIFHV